MAIIPSDEKVFMVDKRTNTIYGGSAALKAMSEWYTMEDVSNTVRPYKVYTALLTQSGSDGQYVNVIEEDLIIGSTYSIKVYDGGDFTNVGAPNNNEGTYFVATGTTPNSWGSSVLKYCSSAPVATVLENTIGNIWFSYNDVGIYYVMSDGLFIQNKTFNTISDNMDLRAPNAQRFSFNYAYINTGQITVYDPIGDVGQDGNLINTPIEIRVYN